MSAYLGFDVGGTNIRYAAVAAGTGGAQAGPDGAGGPAPAETAATGAAPPTPGFLGQRPLPGSYEGLLDCLEELTLAQGGRPLGVGVGLPGLAHGSEVTWVPNVAYLHGRSLAADLERRLGAPVFLANDAQLALLGEARYGAARRRAAVLLVSIGTGIGGAVLIGGRIYRGAHGTAGAFGWLNLGRDAPRHPEHGQLELLASGTALSRRAAELDPPLSATELLAAARAGNAAAAAVVGRAARELGMALASLASVFDPEAILVSGGVSEALEALRAGIAAAVEEYASPTGRSVPIRAAALGAGAGALGATVAAAARDEAFLW